MDFQRQYKHTEIQLLIRNTATLATLQDMLSHHTQTQHAITILPL